MGFSSPPGADAVHQHPGSAASQPSFGDRLMTYLQNKYPVAGGLANAAFGGHQSSDTNPSVASLPPVQGMEQPDYSQMLAMNAQPKQGGGGLSTILKLLAG
jgi:hypothetical protein